MFHAPEKYRVSGYHAMYGNLDDMKGSNFGVFRIPAALRRSYELRIIASEGEGWEHVSVSTAVRCPTWDEMCYVKNLFWDDEDCVVQYHPPKADYINNHPHCLHLWRPTEVEIPRPPSILVGV